MQSSFLTSNPAVLRSSCTQPVVPNSAAAKSVRAQMRRIVSASNATRNRLQRHAYQYACRIACSYPGTPILTSKRASTEAGPVGSAESSLVRFARSCRHVVRCKLRGASRTRQESRSTSTYRQHSSHLAYALDASRDVTRLEGLRHGVPLYVDAKTVIRVILLSGRRLPGLEFRECVPENAFPECFTERRNVVSCVFPLQSPLLLCSFHVPIRF